MASRTAAQVAQNNDNLMRAARRSLNNTDGMKKLARRRAGFFVGRYEMTSRGHTARLGRPERLLPDRLPPGREEL